MANQVGEINVKIGADTTSLSGGVNHSKKKLKELGSQVEQTSKDSTIGFKKMGAAAAGFAAAYLTIGSAIKAIKLTDEFNLLETRVRTATKATGDFSSVYKQLSTNAMAAGSSLEGTVSAFQSISAAGKDLGKTNNDAIQFVDTFQKLGAIGGASTEAMKNSLTQMSQSMAGGVVRAEEFNSIIENTPEVARAMADSLGKSVGELRMMVLEGELMASDVFDAILNKSKEVNTTFAEMPLTLGRASETVTTSFGLMFSAVDDTYKVTQFLAETLDIIAGKAAEIASRLNEDKMTNKAWELVDAQKELNGLMLFSNRALNPIRIKALQDEINLIQEQMSGIASANKVFAEMDKRALEVLAKKKAAEDLSIGAVEAKIWKENTVLDVLLNQAIAQEKGVDAINKQYEASQEQARKVAERELESNKKAAEKIQLLEVEAKWRKDIAEFEGVATGEDQVIKDQERTKAALEALQEKYLTEQELLTINLQDKQFIIDEALLNEQLTAQEHQDLMTKINQEGAEARKKLDDIEYKKKLSLAQSALGSLSNLMNTNSKEMFEIGKTAATANAIINTYTAATGAYAAMASIPYVGPALGAAAAAAAVAGGMANVQQIQSQSFGGGAASPVSYAGGTPAVNTQSAGGGGGAPEGGTLTVQGLSASSLFTGDTVAAIAEELLSYQERGGSVVLQG